MNRSRGLSETGTRSNEGSEVMQIRRERRQQKKKSEF
jgi:hypothetical protein